VTRSEGYAADLTRPAKFRDRFLDMGTRRRSWDSINGLRDGREVVWRRGWQSTGNSVCMVLGEMKRLGCPGTVKGKGCSLQNRAEGFRN